MRRRAARLPRTRRGRQGLHRGRGQTGQPRETGQRGRLGERGQRRERGKRRRRRRRGRRRERRHRHLRGRVGQPVGDRVREIPDRPYDTTGEADGDGTDDALDGGGRLGDVGDGADIRAGRRSGVRTGRRCGVRAGRRSGGSLGCRGNGRCFRAYRASRRRGRALRFLGRRAADGPSGLPSRPLHRPHERWRCRPRSRPRNRFRSCRNRRRTVRRMHLLPAEEPQREQPAHQHHHMQRAPSGRPAHHTQSGTGEGQRGWQGQDGRSLRAAERDETRRYRTEHGGHGGRGAPSAPRRQ